MPRKGITEDVTLRTALDITDFLGNARNIILRNDAGILIHMDAADRAMLAGEGQIGEPRAVRERDDALYGLLAV